MLFYYSHMLAREELLRVVSRTIHCRFVANGLGPPTSVVLILSFYLKFDLHIQEKKYRFLCIGVSVYSRHPLFLIIFIQLRNKQIKLFIYTKCI